MKRIFVAAATATILAAGGAFAQATPTEQPAEMTWEMHDQNASMLRDSVETEFATRGIDYPAGALTLDQLSEIFLVFNNESLDGDEALAQVEQIIQDDAM